MIPTIPTLTAQMGDKEHLFWGYEAFGELLGQETLTGLLALSVGLPRLSPQDLAMFNDLASVNVLGDPRIWPVKMARLVASYGSALHGFTAGMLMNTSTFIGAGTIQRGAELQLEAMNAIGGPEGLNDKERVERQVEAILSRERWPGFGVPFRKTDERMDALKIHLQKNGRDQRPFWRLVMMAEEYTTRVRKTGINIVSGINATMLDMGLSPVQCGWMFILLLQTNFSSAAFEGAQQKSPVLQELPASCVKYEGQALRRSPRAQKTNP